MKDRSKRVNDNLKGVSEKGNNENAGEEVLKQ